MVSLSLGDVWKELGNLGMADLNDFPADKRPGWVRSYLNRLNTSSPPTSPPLTSDIVNISASHPSSPTLTTISSASSSSSSPRITSLLSYAYNTPLLTPDDRGFLHAMSDQHYAIIRKLREIASMRIYTHEDMATFVTEVKRALQEMRAWLLRFCQEVQPLMAGGDEYDGEGNDNALRRRHRHEAMVGTLAPVVETICLFYDFWGHEERSASLRDERDEGRLRFADTEVVYPSQPRGVGDAMKVYHAEYPGHRIGGGGGRQGGSGMGGGGARLSPSPLVGYGDGDGEEREEEAGISGLFAEEYSV